MQRGVYFMLTRIENKRKKLIIIQEILLSKKPNLYFVPKLLSVAIIILQSDFSQYCINAYKFRWEPAVYHSIAKNSTSATSIVPSVFRAVLFIGCQNYFMNTIDVALVKSSTENSPFIGTHRKNQASHGNKDMLHKYKSGIVR